MLKISDNSCDRYSYVTLDGRLGAVNSVDVGAQLVNILEQGPELMYLDLANLAFLDSSGLSVFVSLLKRARKNGGDIVLLDMTDRIRTLFELTRLHEVFQISKTSDQEPLRLAS